MDSSRKIVFFILFIFSSCAFASDIGKLEKMIKNKHYNKAYQFARENINTHAGDAKFDFLYGMAALNSGRSREAIFSFERALMLQPNNHRVRLELAMAFYNVRRYDAAAANFHYVLKTNPPKNVQANIKRMLAIIKAQKDSPSDKSKFILVKFKTGYDTNVNSATELQLVDIPTLGTIVLNANSRAVRSAYFSGNIMGGFIIPITKRTELFSRFGTNRKRNFNNTGQNFDIDNVHAMGGIIYKFNKRNKLTLPVLFQAIDLNGAAFKHLAVYGIEYSHQWNKANKWALYGDMRNDMNPANMPQDALQYTAGVSWHHAITKWRSDVASKVFFSRKVAKRATGTFNGNKQYGVEGKINFNPKNSKYKPFVRVDLQRKLYDALHPIFALVRNDSIIDLSAGLKWKMTPRVGMNSQYRFVKQNSNVGMFEYNRHYIEFGIDYKLL